MKLTSQQIRDAAGGSNPVGEWLQRALDDGKAEISEVNGKHVLRYVAVNHTEIYDDKEEWVRADFWANLIYHYQYPESRLGVEVPVPDRIPSDRADIVIYRDDDRKDPFAVIECKPEDATDAEFTQAVEQVVGNGTWTKNRGADYTAVVAGPRMRVLSFVAAPIGERDTNVEADFPKAYARPDDWRYRAGQKGTSALVVVDKDRLLKIFRRCHDTLWGGGHMDPSTAFDELCKLLFVKIFDERKGRKLGEAYEVQIRARETPTELAARLTSIYNQYRKTFPDIFTSDLSIPAPILGSLVEQIQGISFNGSEIDAKGVAFEQLMGDLFKGKLGQYFTPREIVHFILEMTGVDQDEWVIDPACGSGGFLLEALKVIREKTHEYAGSDDERRKVWQDFADTKLFGIEISEKLARVAKMNMILHGDGHTNVVRNDALDTFKTLGAKNKHVGEGEFDLLLTNVPFGAQIKQEEKDYPIGDFFWLGNTHQQTKTKGVTQKPRKSQMSEVLFMERIWQLLHGDARAAVIVPDGILTNDQLSYVRDFIFDHFQVTAVISLPGDAFTHYGANVKSSILFMRKLRKDEKPDNTRPVFCAEIQSVGYDAVGRPAPNQLEDIPARYRAFLADPCPAVVEVPQIASFTTTESDEGVGE